MALKGQKWTPEQKQALVEKRQRRELALKNVLAKIKLDAAKHVAKVVNGEHPDSSVPWKEVTGETRASLILTQAALSEERVVKAAQTAPKTFGVVIINEKLPAKEWEAKVIERKEPLGLSQEVVQLPPVKRKLSEQLGGNLQAKQDPSSLCDAEFTPVPDGGTA